MAMCTHNNEVGLKLADMLYNTGRYVCNANVMNVPIDFYIGRKGVFCQILKICFSFFRMDQMSFVMYYFRRVLLNNVQESNWRI